LREPKQQGHRQGKADQQQYGKQPDLPRRATAEQLMIGSAHGRL